MGPTLARPLADVLSGPATVHCALCEVCRPHPLYPGRCIYGGPFLGFTERPHG